MRLLTTGSKCAIIHYKSYVFNRRWEKQDESIQQKKREHVYVLDDADEKGLHHLMPHALMRIWICRTFESRFMMRLSFFDFERQLTMNLKHKKQQKAGKSDANN